ncbi:rhomboid family protein [Formosa maritima]|uniref:Rhomboid family intramembrane serine protease n=1 Tax=Formosa maritima TaxID=2592046 RepID=A0A5D0G4R8_9FLAO|nr:rhomboid family intramembrane serine protease [Formosa maritima]TYA53845.1 rhomboid family intramembrane serine protease [Formosa maritima]
MTSLNKDIQDKLQNLNVFEKIIAANLFIFFIGLIIKVSFNINESLSWLELPSSLSEFILKPWSIITYAFVHYDFWHILFNMLWLYFIGRMFSNLFPVKLGLNIYFLGAIFGGLLFLFGYNVIPSFFDTNSRLVGASAAVRALLIFICTYMPNMEVRFFTFNLKLWYLGVAIVVIDFLGLFGLNAGGNFAHLGGALLGYIYAIQLKKGHDIGKGFERIMDWFVSLFKKSNRSPLKTVHKNKSERVAGYTKKDFDAFNNQKKIDVILDKISKSGYDSLTKEEKEFLFKAGK